MVASGSTPEHFGEVFRHVISLRHPNILAAFDAGDDGTLRFPVTAPSVDATLDACLKRDGALPIDVGVSIACDVDAALGYAHVRAVFHGDVRPRHVLLGTVHSLRAFGLAESIVYRTQPVGSAVLTLGRTLYCSPEQLMGQVRLDARSDAYAPGGLLFEMLVGKPPFGGPSRPNHLLKLSQPAPPVREYRETVPEALAEVVRTSLARVTADRYASGEVLAEALGRVRTAERLVPSDALVATDLDTVHGDA